MGSVVGWRRFISFSNQRLFSSPTGEAAFDFAQGPV